MEKGSLFTGQHTLASSAQTAFALCKSTALAPGGSWERTQAEGQAKPKAVFLSWYISHGREESGRDLGLAYSVTFKN